MTPEPEEVIPEEIDDTDDIDCMCDFPPECDGSGMVECDGCGGDACVCICGGEIECCGCPECEDADDED